MFQSVTCTADTYQALCHPQSDICQWKKDVCSALYDRTSVAQISYVSGDPEPRLALSISRTEVRATPLFHLMTESSGF